MRLFLFLLFFIITGNLNADFIPLFKEPDPKAQQIGLLDTSKNFTILREKENLILKNPASEIAYSGIRYSRNCFLVEQNNLRGWAIDGIRLDGNSLRADFKTNPDILWLVFASGILTSIFMLTAFYCFKRKNQPLALWLTDNKNVLLLISLLIVARAFLLGLVHYYTGRYSLLSDGYGYFTVGKALFKTFDFTGVMYTVGNAFVHGLFSVMTGAEAFEDIVFPLSYFNSFFTGTGIIILIFLLAHMLFKSRITALITATAYASYPFLVQIAHKGNIYVTDYINHPSTTQYSLQLYYFSELIGFETESDFINLFATLFTAVLACKFFPLNPSQDQNKNYAPKLLILGFLFGFSGTIRVANIFLAPLLVYTVLRYLLAEEKFTIRNFIKWGFFFSTGAVFGFAPQFWANYMESGSFLTLPYKHHSNIGYNFGLLLQNSTFLLNGISMLFSFSMAGFLLLEKQLRIFFLLYIIPTVFYYGVYTVTCGDAIRFIFPVYPALFLLTALFIFHRTYAFSAALLIFLIFKSSAPLQANFCIIATALAILCATLLFAVKKFKLLQVCKENMKSLLIVLAANAAIVSMKFLL